MLPKKNIKRQTNTSHSSLPHPPFFDLEVMLALEIKWRMQSCWIPVAVALCCHLGWTSNVKGGRFPIREIQASCSQMSQLSLPGIVKHQPFQSILVPGFWMDNSPFPQLDWRTWWRYGKCYGASPQRLLWQAFLFLIKPIIWEFNHHCTIYVLQLLSGVQHVFFQWAAWM